jgi:hypothetical protein
MWRVTFQFTRWCWTRLLLEHFVLDVGSVLDSGWLGVLHRENTSSATSKCGCHGESFELWVICQVSGNLTPSIRLALVKHGAIDSDISSENCRNRSYLTQKLDDFVKRS